MLFNVNSTPSNGNITSTTIWEYTDASCGGTHFTSAGLTPQSPGFPFTQGENFYLDGSVVASEIIPGFINCVEIQIGDTTHGLQNQGTCTTFPNITCNGAGTFCSSPNRIPITFISTATPCTHT